MPRIFSFKPSITLKGRKFRGVRGWAGKPSHPPFTDFPIAAYMLAAAFDVISYVASGGEPGSSLARDSFVAATWVTTGGALLSVAAATTGFWDWWKGIEREPSSGFLGRAKHSQVWRTMNWHMTVMLGVTAIVVIDIILRLAGTDDHATLPITALSVLAAGLVSYGAVYGGALVYDYQFNVETLEGSTAWDENEVDQLPGDKPSSPW